MKNKLILFLLLLMPIVCSAQWTIGSRPFTAPSSGGGGGGGTPTLVNSVSTGDTNADVLSLGFVTVGHAVVVAYYTGAGSGEAVTFTDTLGNTYTTLASANLSTDGDTIAIGCAVIASGGSDSINFFVGGVDTGGRGMAYEYSNVTCAQDVTAVSHNTTGATACSSSAMTTSTANDLLVGVCGTDGNQTTTMTAGSGWSNVENAQNAGANFIMAETQVASTPGSFTATSGTLQTAMEQTTILVALKP